MRRRIAVASLLCVFALGGRRRRSVHFV